MKVCLITTYSNMTVGNDNHKSIEASGLRDLMLQNGADEVHLIGERSRLNVDTVTDYDEVDLEDYDKIFVQLSPPNFFGGRWSERLEWLVEELPKVTLSKIYILPTDPNILFTNPAEQLVKRGLDWCKEHVEAWNIIKDKAHYIAPGPDIEKFIGHTPKSWSYVPWFYFVHAKCLSYTDVLAKPADHVCYWGAHRGRYREMKLRHFLADNRLKVRLVGYASDETSLQTRYYKRVKQHALGEHISQCYTSLIVGDEAHEGNVVTFRLWEAIAGGSWPVIDLEYDPYQRLEESLGVKLGYINGAEDILDEVEHWERDKVIALQVAAQRFLTREAEKCRLW
jgi:hypothetical protein